MTPPYQSLSIYMRFQRYVAMMRDEIVDLRRQVMEREVTVMQRDEEIRKLKLKGRRKR